MRKRLLIFTAFICLTAPQLWAVDVKISDLTELSAPPAVDDVLPIVDTSATTTKKITYKNLMVDPTVVDALMTYGSGTSFTKATIESAKTAIGTSSKTTLLARAGSWTITDDTTITANITLKAPAGTTFAITSGKVLTINGPVDFADDIKFTGAGTVVFGPGSVEGIKAAWFGFAYGTNDAAQATTNLAAINKAATSFASATTGGLVTFPSGTFKVDPGIKPNRRAVEFRGVSSGYSYEPGGNSGTPGTKLVFTAGTYGFDLADQTLTNGQDLTKVSNMRIDGNNVLQYGIGIKGIQLVEDVSVANCTKSGIYVVDYLNSTHIDKVSLTNNAEYGLLIDGVNSTTGSFRRMNVHDNTLGGVKIAAGTHISFEDSVLEGNVGPGLTIYRTAGQYCDHLTFKNVWVENNGDTTGYQIVVDSNTYGTAAEGPWYIRFENCKLRGFGTQKGYNLLSGRHIQFINDDTVLDTGGYEYTQAAATQLLDVTWEPKTMTAYVTRTGDIVTTNSTGGQVAVSGFTIITEAVTFDHASALFNAAATTDNTVIWQQPAVTLLLGVRMYMSEQFAATGMTDLDVTIGDGGDADGIIAQTMNLTSDAVNNVYQNRGALWNGTGGVTEIYEATAHDWYGYATAVGANLSTLTAGSVTFYFTYRNL